MNMKEAIYFLEHEVKLFPHEAKSLPACLKIYKIAENIEEIIELLKRGEKYEVIVKELENCLLPEQYKVVKKLELKYSPKGGY